MTSERALVFVDNKEGRGGGQVVLEELLAACVQKVRVALAMPPAGRAAIDVPAGVHQFDDLGAALVAHRGMTVKVVANANAAFPQVITTVRRLPRERRAEVRTVAIVHNYPSTVPKAAATRLFLRQFDEAYVVEPGLLQLRADASVPPWLSIRPRDAVLATSEVRLTGRIKSYGRPDPSKGLHLLPELFGKVEGQWTCEVALGDGLDGRDRYEDRLRAALGPWLVEGRRTVDWIEPGDVFVIPSVSGEAACLTAQEALAKGALVVASRVGLMPYLLPEGHSMRTFPVGDMSAAAAQVRGIGQLDPVRLSTACVAGAAAISARRGVWYEHMVEALCEAP